MSQSRVSGPFMGVQRHGSSPGAAQRQRKFFAGVRFVAGARACGHAHRSRQSRCGTDNACPCHGGGLGRRRIDQDLLRLASREVLVGLGGEDERVPVKPARLAWPVLHEDRTSRHVQGRIVLLALGPLASLVRGTECPAEHLKRNLRRMRVQPKTGRIAGARATGPRRGAGFSRTASPNPGIGRTAFTFALPLPRRARLTEFDAAGRRVATLVGGEVLAGEHKVTWTAPARPGIYFALLETRQRVRRTVRVVRVDR